LPPEDVLFGASRAMLAIREMADKLATAVAPILIEGETGTGKDVLVAYLHSKAPESPLFTLVGPLFEFPPVDDDPLSETIVEMVRTLGPDWVKQEAPLRGTLVLDDIAFLDMVMQVRLLEKVAENPLLRIQLPQDRLLELRLICTTNRPLQPQVKSGHFLRELYHLIRVFTLELPPLRERREDLPRLTSYFLEFYNRKFGAPRLPPSPQIFQKMSEYDWPGNVRELENLIMRYVVQGSEDVFAGELGAHGGPVLTPKAFSP
jgi:DNA-binding NtrC family response regulator